jgi:glutamate 5-kinase
VIVPKKENIILSLLNGEKIGSFIYPYKEKITSRKKSWLKLLSEPKGRIIIDKGAEKALKDGKSLLPAGIKEVEGIFNKKDVVAILNEDGEIVGKGIVNYSKEELKKIKGLKSKEVEKILGNFTEAIHRDNLIILE